MWLKFSLNCYECVAHVCSLLNGGDTWISPKVSAAANRISMWFISRSVRNSHNLLRNTSVMYAWDDTDGGHGIACQVEDSRATSSVVKIEAKVYVCVCV